MSNDIIYNWSFSNDKQRGKLWYIIALSIIFGFVIWGFLTKQYIMSFFVILISGVYFFIENNTDELTQVAITNLGMFIGNKFYEFTKIDGYSIIFDNTEAKILRISLKNNNVSNFIDLYINNEIAQNLNSILPNVIEQQDEIEIGMYDKIIRLLKL